MSGPSFWNQKSFVVITGASRGLGRTMAIEFSKKVAPGSVLLLLARSSTALQETKSLVTSTSVHVITASIDLAQPDKEKYFDLLKSAVDQTGPNGLGGQAADFDHAILVNNAASLGNMAHYVSKYEDLKELQDYYNFNVISMVLLTSQFLRVFDNPERQRSVIQITSGLANLPMKTMGYYCSGKAARDMLISILAIEEPSIYALSYSPGMFQSDMNEEATRTVGDEEVRKLFVETKEAGKVGTAEQSTGKLIQILENKRYTSGQHVDIENITDNDSS